MSELQVITEKFKALRVCVIIPTYNNGGTLAAIISDVSKYTRNIILVNDGSTDETPQIIASFPFLQEVSYPDNIGKGWALRKGFACAMARGYDYAITIDSDGQHFASDIPAFINKLQEAPEAIIVGSRNMEQASVPGKSSFGHKFSNFWYKVETGVNCPDTQSGFRLYPLRPLAKMRFFTVKYEFEIEVLVRGAWKGIDIADVPVTVHYAPKETRVSHFRPFQDFSRVSILNTVLVIIAFAYIKPRDFFAAVFDKKKSKKEYFRQLLNLDDSDQLKAASIGVGVFAGILPAWGFQLWIGLAIALIFRLNKAIVILASNISIPPMIPLIIFLSYKAGGIWIGDKMPPIAFNTHFSVRSIGQHLEQYIYGSITLAFAAGLLAGLLTFVLLKLRTKKAAPAF